MNKIIYIILIALITSGCKDFLKEESKSQMSTEYYNTPQGMYEGVAAAYSSCRELFREPLFETGLVSDLVDNASSNNNSYFLLDINGGTVNNCFNEIHQGVMIMNRMLRAIDKDQTGNPAYRIYKGELLALRSLFHYYNVELWGKYAHVQTKVYDAYEDSMLFINQMSVELQYKQILDDINAAIPLLPTQSTIKEFGRISQGAAKAIKARILMTLAGYGNDHYSGQPEKDLFIKLGYSSINALYTEAMNLSQEVINDGYYKLENDWWNIFLETNQTGKEIIWSIQWTQNRIFNTDEWVGHRKGCGRNRALKMSKNTKGWVEAIEQDPVVTRNGKTYTLPIHSNWYGREYRHYMPTFAWINMYHNNDKRRGYSFENLWLVLGSDERLPPPDMTDTIIYMPFEKISVEENSRYRDWVASKGENAYYKYGLNAVYDMDDPSDTRHYGGALPHRSSYPNLKKFYDRSRIDEAKQDMGYENATVFRLAEMYLNIAECKWRLGQGDAAVYEALRPLWERAFNHIADADAYKPTGGVDIHFILDEWSRELGMEFNSFFILKRTCMLYDRIKKNHKIGKQEDENKVARQVDLIEKYMMIRPLPINQIRRFKNITSRGQLPPGYPDYAGLFGE